VRSQYSPNLIYHAREMRHAPTPAERKLWYDFLRGLPFRVRRQCPIAGYIPDFYIHKFQLVIEVDGESHFTPEALIYDAERTMVLGSMGLRVIRFTNHEVLHQFEAVCEDIQQVLNEPQKASTLRGGVREQ
jgi:very-short-patch-repair endonuclease